MFELHQVVAAVLFSLLAVFLAVFWGSALFSLAWGKYVYEGSVKVWNLPRHLNNLDKWYIPEYLHLTYIITGFFIPLLFTVISFDLVAVIKGGGLVVPYIFLGFLLAWFSLFIMRAVVRLTKKLDDHKSDKSAHKTNRPQN